MRFSCNRSMGRVFSLLIFYVLRFVPLPTVGSAVALLCLIWGDEIPTVVLFSVVTAFLVRVACGVLGSFALGLSASREDDVHSGALNVDGCSSRDVDNPSCFPRGKSRFLYGPVRSIARALGACYVNRVIFEMPSIIMGDSSERLWGRRMTNSVSCVGYRGGWCSYGA